MVTFHSRLLSFFSLLPNPWKKLSIFFGKFQNFFSAFYLAGATELYGETTGFLVPCQMELIIRQFSPKDDPIRKHQLLSNIRIHYSRSCGEDNSHERKDIKEERKNKYAWTSSQYYAYQHTLWFFALEWNHTLWQIHVSDKSLIFQKCKSM